ncbi:ATP-dependent DNA helicase [Acaricomes phytoseiuli]|nr:ATP-dependent DNA helicase [Acaricomes phytoseiuli]
MGGQHRAGQHEMARHVVRSFSTGEHLLVQAGTGTGKSLAYLIPLLLHALRSERPSLVATATLALQAQIMGRDIPRLLEIIQPELERPVSVALVKGRSNYLCKHKTAGGFPEEEPEAGQLFALGEDGSARLPGTGAASVLGREVTRLREWAEETETGDRDELNPGVSERAWRQVSVSSRECLGAQRCPVADECFSELAKLRAAEADLVVTNHAMLAISAFDGLAVLPEYDAVVIDEAHELVDRVTGAVSGQLSAAMVEAAAAAARKHTAIEVEALQHSAQALDKALHGQPAGWLPEALNQEQYAAIDQVRDAARIALSDSKGESSQVTDGGRQLARSRLQLIFEQTERLLAAVPLRESGQPDAGEVIWITRAGSFDPQQGYRAAEDTEPATLNIAPLSVAMRLRDKLFGEHTAVLTSATLAVGAAFEPVAGNLGLLGDSAPSWTGADVGSPFDYPRQGVLYVAADLERPGRGTSPAQLDELEQLLRASRGGALCLFSSRRAAEDAADEMRSRLSDFEILCQGESSMASLIREFQADPDACLFGTMSLWQGVDVPGDSCRLVTIDRIPFPRPDDPLTNARTRAVAMAGGNGFMSISAAHAAVRLAQGAGRLIRSMEDRGVVAVLDSRLATARYGGFLRAALPPFWPTTDREVTLAALQRLRSQSESSQSEKGTETAENSVEE